MALLSATTLPCHYNRLWHYYRPLHYPATTIDYGTTICHYTTQPLHDPATTLPHYPATTLPCHYTTLPLHNPATTLPSHYITLPLHYPPTTLPCYDTTLPLHQPATTLSCHYTILPLHHPSATTWHYPTPLVIWQYYNSSFTPRACMQEALYYSDLILRQQPPAEGGRLSVVPREGVSVCILYMCQCA